MALPSPREAACLLPPQLPPREGDSSCLHSQRLTLSPERKHRCLPLNWIKTSILTSKQSDKLPRKCVYSLGRMKSSSGSRLPNDKSLKLIHQTTATHGRLFFFKVLQQKLCGNNFCFLLFYILTCSILLLRIKKCSGSQNILKQKLKMFSEACFLQKQN